MQITIANKLQDKFKAGLQIVGEDSEGNIAWERKGIRPFRVEMPERMENSQVHPDMSISESIIHSVIQKPMDDKLAENKLKWMSPTDGLHGSGKANL